MAKTPSSANSGAPLVQALADILDKTGLVELEYETEAVSIRLSKATPAMMAQPVAAAPVAASSAAILSPTDTKTSSLYSSAKVDSAEGGSSVEMSKLRCLATLSAVEGAVAEVS